MECINFIERKYDFKFKEKQTESILSILDGRDTFIVLPTGYGKTNIYSYLPEMFEQRSGQNSSILVISPLQALMHDQVHKLQDIGITCTIVGECQKDKGIAKKISSGEFSIVFSSPEAALIPGLWRQSFTNGTFQKQLKAVVIDEAHCITEWGAEFRQEYSRLAELRSIVPDETPFVTLTATATQDMRREIIKTLEMDPSSTNTISLLPDRTNLIYHVQFSKKDFRDINWLLEDLKENRTNAKKTVVYCRNINTCARLYEHFFVELKQNRLPFEERSIAMYHRSTAELNKNHVCSTFPKNDSPVRVVFATIAFGMGIDIPDIERIIHWGAPRGLEQFVQESGRAGRDGRSAVSIIYFSSHDLSKGNCQDAMKELCKSKGCIRKTIMKHFSLGNEDDILTSEPKKCCCCCNCKESCTCGNCKDTVLVNNVQQDCNDLVLDDNDEVCRYFSPKEKILLHDNFVDYRDCLLEEGNSVSLDMEFIDILVDNSPYLLCKDDIISLGLKDHSIAADLLDLIEEVTAL